MAKRASRAPSHVRVLVVRNDRLRLVINGAHAIIFSKDADAVRSFLRDALGFPSVDAGGGWLIFALPPAELAAHPTEGAAHHELYLMCDDIHATVAELKGKGVEFSRPISDERFGLITAIKVPGGGELALYEPKHASLLSPNV
jgi:catechol 2,3-dioxygenase-like lactoylglutathione lyase family enzyme